MNEYHTEQTTGPDGKAVWIADDPGTVGPYGIGDTAEEAVADLENGLALWGRQAARRLSVSDGGSDLKITSTKLEVTGWAQEERRVAFA